MSSFSFFNNLQTTDPPVRSYMSTTEQTFSELYGDPRVSTFPANVQQNTFDSLYHEPEFSTATGGMPMDPNNFQASDNDVYVPVYFPLEVRDDGSHLDVLVKHALCFTLKKDPSDVSSNYTAVSLGWMNGYWNINFNKAKNEFQRFCLAFYKKYKIYFVQNSYEVSSQRIAKQTQETDWQNWNDEDFQNDDGADDGDDGSLDVSTVMMSVLCFCATRLKGTDFLFEEDRFFEENRPDFSERSWDGHDDDGSSDAGKPLSFFQNFDLEKTFTADQQLVLEYRFQNLSNETGARDAFYGGNSKNLYLEFVSDIGGKNFEEAKKKWERMEFVQKKLVDEMIRTMTQYLSKSTKNSKGYNFQNESLLLYLFKGGFEHFWTYLGTFDVIYSKSKGGSSYVGQFESITTDRDIVTWPSVKIKMDGEAIIYNIWGENIPINSKLYLVGKRIAKNNEHDYSTLSRMPLSQRFQEAWYGYGAYCFVPAAYSKNDIDPMDHCYLDVFGNIEYPEIIYVGRSKYSVSELNYPYRMRYDAIGMEDPKDLFGFPADPKSSTKNLLTLPTMTVILKR